MEPYAIWVIVGVVTLILELLSGTMYLMWLACGCFLAAVVAWLAPEVAWAPWAMFAISTSVLVYLGRGWASRLHGKSVPSNEDRQIGQSGVVIEDLGSTNGTYLNRKKVTAPVVVQTGDVIQVGSTVLELQ